jgi:hypothetical protein
MRNLQSDVKDIMRRESSRSSRQGDGKPAKFTFNAEKIGSIQKSYQSRSAIDSETNNYETAKFGHDEDIRSQKSSVSTSHKSVA